MKAVLEGGPADLLERIVQLKPPGNELKVTFRNGYEHFKATSRFKETPEGRLPIYQWDSRTEMCS